MCESYVTIMADLQACRVCLATGEKLFNIYTYNLKNIYESLTGTKILTPDIYPHYMCAYCFRLLIKSNSFKERCIRAQELLKFAAMEITMLSQDYVPTLTLSQSPTYSVSISPTELTPDIKIKDENIDILEELSNSSDMEPLSKKIIKKSLNVGFFEFEFGNNLESDTVSDNIEYPEFTVEKIETEIETDDFEPSAPEIECNEDIEMLVLSQKQQIEEVMKRKDSFNYQNSFFKCDLCYKGFLSDSSFKNHVLRHDPISGPLSCDICHIRCIDRRSLKAHTISTHERKYLCKLCNQVSSNLSRAKEHLKWHKGHTFTCKICGASFSKSTSCLTHTRLQHPSKFCCDICGESFIGQMGLNMHKKKAHRGIKSLRKNPEFECDVCKIQFMNEEALKEHSKLKYNGKCDTSQTPCVQCGLNFSNVKVLKQHKKTYHREQLVKCDECDRTFANARSFGIHFQRVHLGIKLVQKRERMENRTPAPVVCEICGKKCISKAVLICHQRIHTGEKPFQCPECPKKFSVQQRLQIHMRTHTGERPYQCTMCPKAFKHKAALNRHNRVHTGAKPYHCPHCSKSFSQSNSMKVHVNTVHLKMPTPYRHKRTKHNENNDTNE